MRERIFLFALAGAGALVAALAQTGPSPAPTPAPAEESRPLSAEIPASEAQTDAATTPMTPRGTPASQPAPTTIQPEEEALEEPAPVEQAVIPEESRKRWRIIPLFSAGVVFDDNIFLTNTDRVADVIWTISGGLAFELGDFRGGSENYLIAQWLGMPAFYANNPSENRFNQAGNLLAQYRWTKLVAQLESSFRIAREGNREVNTITTTQTFSNFLRFKYEHSDKTNFDLQFAQTAELTESFQNNYQYEVRAGATYQMFPKTSLGLEGAGGVLDQPSGPLQYFQQARLRINYIATGKLNFKLSGGIEVREFEGNDKVRVNPVFSLGLEYLPFSGTSISLTAYRNIYGSSSLAGQDITATGIELSATQRILQKFIAGISFGYENDVYFATSEESTDADRVDNYMYVRPRLVYSFVDWLTANVFYEFRRTDSNQTVNSFYDNRVGMELALRF